MTLPTDRLQAARQRLFVGRAGERALFGSALTATEPPFYILHVFGLGGVGKSALLREFAELCKANGVHSVMIDARHIQPSPEAFLSALVAANGIAPSESITQSFAGRDRRYVILIDTYELLAPLDQWLREQFLPQLPDNVFIVLAGRRATSREWHLDAGWQHLLRTIPLRNLSPEESHSYLLQRNLPENQHQAILDFTHGHPLALSLVADLFAQQGFDSQRSNLLLLKVHLI